jgi:ubiquinol-cytochrome c reductase iron-sulfur subunit
MTTSRQDPPSRAAENPHPPQVTDADVEEMSQEQLARLAHQLDDVEVVHNQRKFPIPGTRAERRATPFTRSTHR